MQGYGDAGACRSQGEPLLGDPLLWDPLLRDPVLGVPLLGPRRDGWRGGRPLTEVGDGDEHVQYNHRPGHTSGPRAVVTVHRIRPHLCCNRGPPRRPRSSRSPRRRHPEHPAGCVCEAGSGTGALAVPKFRIPNFEVPKYRVSSGQFWPDFLIRTVYPSKHYFWIGTGRAFCPPLATARKG